MGDEEIRNRHYYLQRFGINPNKGIYAEKCMDVKEVDSPKAN
jgi:hypothetical protein